MAEVITFQLDGTKEILDALSDLDPRQTINIIKASERKDLVLNIVTPVRAGVTFKPKTKYAIGITSDRNDRTGLFAGVTSKAFWIRFVEKGTELRTTKSGANRGQIKAKPTVIPIIESQIDNVVNFFNNDFGEEINKILLKRIKKLSK
jgi:hypothetical protein